MALSGTIMGTTANEHIDSKIVWSATQSLPNNTSTIKATLYYKRTNIGYKTYGEWSGKITIGGKSQSLSKSITITENGWTQAGTFTATIDHTADGTKSVRISGTGSIASSTLTSTNCAATITLNPIYRTAVIKSAPNFNDEENPVLTYSNPAGTAATELMACISLTGAADDIAYRNISKTETSYTFVLTDAERKVLRQATKNNNSRSVRFYIRSTIGGYQGMVYVERTLSIVNANPTFTYSITDTNAITTALTGNNGVMVKGFSNANITITATAKKEATISNTKVANGSKERIGSGVINAVDSGTFIITVLDSRSNRATATVNRTLINYFKPSLVIENTLPTADGKFNYTVKGKYFNGSFGSTTNTLIVMYRYKGDNDIYSNWAAMTITKSGNSYTAVAAITGLDYRQTYTFQAYVKDALSNVYSADKTVKTTPVFDWGKDDFNVNGSFGLNGGAVLRRNIDNNNTVLSATDAANGIFLRPNGTGSSEGQAILDINGNLTINGDIIANNIRAGNAILWSGTSYMTSSQSISLSQSIADQPNGIVLVFSRYSNGAAENANFNSFYVPKSFVATHSGVGSAFQMGTVNFSVMCCKYLYISNDSISGNDLNTSTGTGTSGIKYENNAYVLRYVIGV